MWEHPSTRRLGAMAQVRAAAKAQTPTSTIGDLRRSKSDLAKVERQLDAARKRRAKEAAKAKAAGLTYAQIGKALGCSAQWAERIVRQAQKGGGRSAA